MERKVFAKEVVATKQDALAFVDKLLNLYCESTVEKEGNSFYVTSTDGQTIQVTFEKDATPKK